MPTLRQLVEELEDFNIDPKKVDLPDSSTMSSLTKHKAKTKTKKRSER